MSPTRIHHLNFVVRDLEKAAADFEGTLGLEPFVVVDHEVRGSRVARSRLGESWLVLVCPDDPDSLPGRHLAEHGEGFFLLSVGTADLDSHLDVLANSGRVDQKSTRRGILDWRVADIGELHGALLQLTDDSESGSN